MKHTRFAFEAVLVGGLLAATLPGCDVVDAPVPPRQVLTVEPKAARSLDSLETLQPAETPVQRVLLEDYTGHQCGNCPRAARKATELVAQYGDRLVVVATHVGYYARLSPPHYTYDFHTAAGDELNTTYGVDQLGLPQGMINRMPPANATSPAVSDGAWSGLVAEAMTRSVEQQLILTPLYTPATRSLLLKVRAKYLLERPGHSYRLVVNILEDSIREWQKDYAISDPANPAKDDSAYYHRHVLRAAPLGTFGVLDVANPQAGQVVDAYLRYELPVAWNDRHCLVVAYLIDDATKRVAQVAETLLQ